MELTITIESGPQISLRKQEFVINVYPYDIGIRAVSKDVFTAKGQLLVSTAAGTVTVIGPPAAGEQVVGDPSTPSGWAIGSGGGAAVSTMTNKSGIALANGDVVVLDPSNDRSVVTTTIQSNMAVAGVVQEDIANNSSGAIGTFAGHIVQVNCDTVAVAKGNYLVTSTTATLATSLATKRSGVFAIALTSKSTGLGTVWAMLLEITPLLADISSLTSMNMWLKPEYFDGVAHNTQVGTWGDSSPAAVSFIQATAGIRPAVATNYLNGYPALYFNGSTYTLYRASGAIWSGNAARTTFLVGACLTGTNTYVMRQGGTNVYAIGWAASSGWIPFIYTTGAYASSSTASTTPVIIGAVADSTSLELYKNGVINGTHATPVLSTGAVATYLGSGGTGNWFNGYLVEVINFAARLSVADIALVHYYLSNKYGLTL